MAETRSRLEIRSMPTLVAGVVVTASGLTVALAEGTPLSLGQAFSLMALLAALVVFAAAVARARRPADRTPAGKAQEPATADDPADLAVDEAVDQAPARVAERDE